MRVEHFSEVKVPGYLNATVNDKTHAKSRRNHSTPRRYTLSTAELKDVHARQIP
jgi:hypothetical protein